MKLTPQLVREYWAFMSQKYRTTIVQKQESENMKILAEALGLMNVLNPKDFLTRFATTIGRNIYIPFEIGVESTAFSLWDQIGTGAHEHQHVIQLDADPNFFSTRYLLDPIKRALYESEAYRVNLTLNFWYSKVPPKLEPYLEALKNYGIQEQEIDFAREYLKLSLPTIVAGGIPDQATRDTIDWLTLNFPA